MKTQLLSLLLVVTMFSACGKQLEQTDSNSPLGAAFNGGRVLTSGDASHIKNICDAFKAKRDVFESYSDSEKSFKFKTVNKDCFSNTVDERQLRAYLSVRNSRDLYFYAASRARFLGDVFTDKFEYFETICANKLKKNVVDLGDLKIVYNFRKDSQGPIVLNLQAFVKQINGAFEKSTIQEIYVNTDKKSKTYGHVLKRERVFKCVDSDSINVNDYYLHERI